MLSDLFADVRYAVRQLGRAPGFAAVAVLALGLGIGANTAIFSAVDALLLRSLPYPDADGLAMVWEDASHVGFPLNTPAPANYVDWRRQNQVFSDMAALRLFAATVTGEGAAEMLLGTRGTANLFHVLGVQPAIGRGWTAREEQESANVVVLGHGLWRRRFAADTGVTGRTVQLSGVTHTIIGVMPPEFAFPDRERDLYVPMNLQAEGWARRGSHFLQVVARLKTDVTLERARGDMATIARRLQAAYPETNAKLGAVVVPLRESMLGDTRPQLFVLLGAAGCVLLIACANVANLLLSRATARQREMAVRSALGASATRLLRQSLTESLVLAGAGAAVGLLLAAMGVRGINRLVPEGYVGATQVTLDWRVLAATLALAFVTAVLFGLAPALRTLAVTTQETLKQGGRGLAGGRSHWLRNGLVVAEVALSLLLLVTAGLLLQTLLRLRGLEAGFRTDHLLVIRTSLAHPQYQDAAKRQAFLERAVERLQGVPGVERVAFASTLPFQSVGNTNSFEVEGRGPREPGNEQDALMRVATTDYLRLLGVRLAEGRLFDSTDRAGGVRSVVINRHFARTYWPNGSALGKRIRFGADDTPWTTVVGVIEDVRERGFERPMKFGAYMPTQHNPDWTPSSLAIRTTVEPASVVPAIRQAVKELDPDLPLARVRTMEEVMGLELVRREQQVMLLEAFAGLALVLASIGLYGVLSYAVSQRAREIGIRMALGARAGTVVRDVLRQGAGLAGLGIVIGSAASLAMARAFRAMLFGVTPSDPSTYMAMAGLLLTVTLVACFVPARRAAAVDPVTVLRDE